MYMTKTPALRRYWYPVAFDRALDDGPVARTLLGESIVVWRSAPGAAPSASYDACPHREAKLSKGYVCDGNIVCPYHGWEFSGNGRLAKVPQLDDDDPLPPKGNLESLRCEERYGWIWVSLDDDPIGGMPELPEFAADGWRVVPEYEWMFECSAAALIENNLDPAHIAFVHKDSFGAGMSPKIDPPVMERTEFGLRRYNEVAVASRPGEEGETRRITVTDLWAPFMGVFRIAYPDGLVHIMVKACTPETDTRTRLLQFVMRNDTEADRPGADIVAFDDKVEGEDQAILDGLPAWYPLDPTEQAHTKADRGTLDLRRWYKEIFE
ncbi:MAG: Rieske 2Fe-2S domain-containing protein [Acidimicrobiia bacterium]